MIEPCTNAVQPPITFIIDGSNPVAAIRTAASGQSTESVLPRSETADKAPDQYSLDKIHLNLLVIAG
jgi:hypothetical protein